MHKERILLVQGEGRTLKMDEKGVSGCVKRTIYSHVWRDRCAFYKHCAQVNREHRSHNAKAQNTHTRTRTRTVYKVCITHTFAKHLSCCCDKATHAGNAHISTYVCCGARMAYVRVVLRAWGIGVVADPCSCVFAARDHHKSAHAYTRVQIILGY